MSAADTDIPDSHDRQLMLDQVRRETAALAEDPDDLAEIRRIRADLDDLRAW
jgi:hypothetical protein